jgi:hypothetical protein
MRSLAGDAVAFDTTTAFYHDAMRALLEARAPFMVGGSHAYVHHTGIARHTKDFDIFVRRSDIDRVLEALERIGCRTERPFPHWLGKAYRDDCLIDVIYCSGNGVAEVDDRWFQHAPLADVLGLEVPLCPAEEMIWSKAFIMERERYDGGDVAHILLEMGPSLDWPRLLERFGPHWRVLYAHLVLFGFIYPSERSRIPRPVMREMARRLRDEVARVDSSRRVTQGPLLSRAQYLSDIECAHYDDVRYDPEIHMTPEDIDLWTRVISDEVRPYARLEGDDPHRRGR